MAHLTDVPDIFTYSDDDEPAAPRPHEEIRRLTSAELDTSSTTLYDESADWNLGAWRDRLRVRTPPRLYVPDVFDECRCRVEILGFAKSSDETSGLKRLQQTFPSKHLAEEHVRKFASSHGILLSRLKMNAACSGAGDVRVVYSDEKGRMIAIRAVS